MSKLPEAYQFVDFSDYGRSTARQIATSLKFTSVTPIQVTYWFIFSGLLAICCIHYHYTWAAAFFLIMKSVLDAADGELSRIKNSPSYVGRYFDSIADIILNFLFLFTFWTLGDYSIIYLILAFIGIQLQGTLYNYYYVILRKRVNGDPTSRVFENQAPKAMKGETQKKVNVYFKIFYFLYGAFDKMIYLLDRNAIHCKPFPKWFMSMVSILGLGFQLLIMAVMYVFKLEAYILPFFIGYTVLIFVFIGLRRVFLK